MKPRNDTGPTDATASNAARLTVTEDLATLDRGALLALIDSLFRWALRHTGLTRQQIIAQIMRDGSTSPEVRPRAPRVS
jgi:hypothetical protein